MIESRDEITQKSGKFALQCPYCGKIHGGKIARTGINHSGNGIITTEEILPCGRKAILFFSANLQYRSCQSIDEINIVHWMTSEEIDGENYNDEWKRFSMQKGVLKRAMSMKPSSG